MPINTLVNMKIGDPYIDDKGDIWVVESFCDRPTVELRLCCPEARDDGDTPRMGGAVGCRLFERLTKLVPEEE